MQRITIGIQVHAEPESLHATLASVRTNSSHAVELLLLPDGPDEATRAALAGLREIPQSGTSEPLGSPACFNRLAAVSDAHVLVLLESGARVGPGWLDGLLAALDADPANGLAGPSTNHAWNEQCVFPRCGSTPAEVAATARKAARRFGSTWRTLEPLHSLSDFCYMVRREALEAVGAADEGYRLGPCWEMDYNIRAARAGFRGVWACSAYVYRAPFTARRRREEALGFEVSKRRYQDKFCALRLRNERSGYEVHCRGEACEHFAPRALIQIHLPLKQGPEPCVLPSVPSQQETASVVSRGEAAPLVSCIMPTGNRGAFAVQSIRYFQRQDYPSRELIIVDDGREDLAGQLPDDSRIRYIRIPPGLTIGAKRNRACELAAGSIIAHWDDDDWYASNRLSVQVQPIVSGEADITGLITEVFFDLARWEFWTCTPGLHRRLFVHDVHGGTLVYRRSVWEQQARYPNASLAEDAAFLRQAVQRGARVQRVANQQVFVYLRHAQNSWSFHCGRYLDPHGWQRVAEPAMLQQDRAFYVAHSAAAPDAAGITSFIRISHAQPLVSCIMPTADRRLFVGQAIQYFLRQNYLNRELIIVDDGVDRVEDLVPSDPRIRYIGLQKKQTIGAKRNRACQEAQGDIVVHWDDDDWMAPWRLTYQVESLREKGADICGLAEIRYYDACLGQAWMYVYPRGEKAWVGGNTLCYTKAFWSRNPFPEISLGEDSRFLWSNKPKRIVALGKTTFFVGLIHPGNTSPKRGKDRRWVSHDIQETRDLMGDDWTFYKKLSQTE
jgi:glycosyltransferase involved in cell wall biosynthesis